MAKTRRLISPEHARAAFEAVVGELELMPEAALLPIRVDVQRAAALAYSVAERDTTPSRYKRFEALAGIGLFGLHDLRRLRTLALACWHARQQQLLHTGASSGAAVPVPILRDAQLTRTTMLRVLEYHLQDHPQFGPKLAFIRTGAGYQDLANDLQMLADLYDEGAVQEAIEGDARHYQPGDAAKARSLAASIFRGLGLGPASELEIWIGAVKRAWALLSKAYDEVAQAGRFAFGKDEDVTRTYPSLVAATRAKRRRSAGPGEEVVDEPPNDADIDAERILEGGGEEESAA